MSKILLVLACLSLAPRVAGLKAFRAQETVELVQRGVLAPIRGINGVAAGIRAALQFLLRGTRPSPGQVTVDEEMFI